MRPTDSDARPPVQPMSATELSQTTGLVLKDEAYARLTVASPFVPGKASIGFSLPMYISPKDSTASFSRNCRTVKFGQTKIKDCRPENWGSFSVHIHENRDAVYVVSCDVYGSWRPDRSWTIAGRDGETTIQSDAAEDHLVFLLQTTKNEGPWSVKVRTDMTPVWTLHGCTIYEA